jgi:hypothetical protein
MTRRVLAFVLAVVTASVAQGSLMYAAAGSAEARTGVDPFGRALAAAVLTAVPVSGTDTLAGTVTDNAIACLRGAYNCFSIGTESCCAEMAALGAIAGTIGAWLPAGIAAFYVYQYCM